MTRDWQIYLLAAFAVCAGQVLRIGQKIEAGKPIAWRDLFVMCTLLPAFGSLAGAAAIHYHWPTWFVLIAGICAGWMGFATMKFVLLLARNAAAQVVGTKVD